MIVNIILELIHWLLVFGLSVLLIVCSNILGFTSHREKDKPSIYYVIVWLTMVCVLINLVVSMHSKEIALLISPFTFAGTIGILFVSTVMFSTKEEIPTIELLQLKLKFHKETIKVLVCLVIFFFITSVYQDLRTKYFPNNKSVSP